MAVPLNVLLLEDRPEDAELLLRELKRAGFTPEWRRIETEADFRSALEAARPEIILADHSMPQFGASRALEIIKELHVDVPLILVSGTVGEEEAVSIIKRGAADYILKDRPARLGEAVRRALEEKRLQEEKQQAEEKYRDIFEHAIEGIYQTSPDGKYITANPATARMLGYNSPEELISSMDLNRQFYVDPNRRAEFKRIMEQHGEVVNFESEVYRKDGRTIWVSENAHAVRDDQGTLLFYEGTTTDITDRKQAEQALRDSEERYRLLFERNPQPMWVYDAKNLNFLAVNDAAIEHYGYSREEFLSMTIRDIRPEEEITTLEKNLAQGRQPRERSGPWKHRKKDGTIINVEIVSHNFEFAKKSARLVLVNDITERLRAEADVKQRLTELEAVNRVSTALRTAQTLDEMLPHFLEETIRALNGSAGSIWLDDPPSNEIRMAYEHGWNYKPPPVRPGEGIPGQVIASGEPYVSREIRTDPKLHEAARNQVPPGRGGACVPIRSAHQVIGALYVNAELPREFNDSDVHLLTTLAEIAGNAIHRVGLHERTLKQLERLASLRAIDITITSSLDLNLTLNVLLDQVIKQLNVDAAAILLQSPESKGLRFAAGKGFWTRDIESTDLRLGEGLPGRAMLERKIIRVGNFKAQEDAFKRPDLMADEKFVSYYAVPLIAKGKIKGVLEIFHRSNLARDPEWEEFMEALGNQAAIAVDNSSLFLDLQRSNLDLALAYDATIEGWSHALDLRDKETEGHTLRVTEMTIKLAQKMGIADEDMVHVRRGALLHDIGKMGVPDNILLKPGKLTDEEWEIMRRHPQYAFDLLTPISYLRRSLDIPFCHHEKWDGTGYPRGLKGEEIPLVARIFAVVDVWDAVTSDRPYRPAWTKDQALKHIQEQSGSHFDPRVVRTFLDMQGDL